MRHIILGAGPAGIIAAETIRKHAPYDSITVVGDEPEPPYSRMAIPYLLVGNVKESGTYLRRDPDQCVKLNIQLLQRRATAVDAARRTVTLDNGSILGFDKLLIATGSQPVRPPIPGMDLPGVHPCWTLENARHIEQLARPGAKVLQMGAGFIGCIIMEALAARGVQLTVVEMGDRMVPRMMGPTAGNMIKAWCEKKGVRVFTGTKVEAIEAAGATRAAAAAPAPASGGLLNKVASFFGMGDSAPAAAPAAPSSAGGSAMRVRLSNGQTIEADLVISATGVKPNVAFLKDSGIECNQGVLADECLQTNVAGIFAAGDCAEAFDLATRQRVISAIQPNAADQAAVAALNMLERGAELKRVTQINVLDTLGLISASFGDWQGVAGGQHVELTDRDGFRHLSLQFDNEKLVGCNSIGWTEHVGVMRGLVEGKVRLGEWRDKLLADPTRLAEAYIAQGQAQQQWAQTHARAR
ncbi:FAD-dependent oxidoreductase [uncultured Methylibium sp.]|uniref:NAD(P)/FAD-dependent oxidoreductase n=1 Tax=uncultured Methylibium sp. TaxID=381093 RepID=UPI0025F75110|nr:FAD-dependent oxidoreductase [uncultured Methylibium sp.]